MSNPESLKELKPLSPLRRSTQLNCPNCDYVSPEYNNTICPQCNVKCIIGIEYNENCNKNLNKNNIKMCRITSSENFETLIKEKLKLNRIHTN